MKIEEMHVWFRQYAQQMGMQNVRAILPEQIDICINTSITDVVNQLIKDNIGISNDRIITDNSKIGQINALRTLYKVKLIDVSKEISSIVSTEVDGEIEETTTIKPFFEFKESNRNIGRLTATIDSNNETELENYMFLVDFSLNYKEATKGLIDSDDYQTDTHKPAFSATALETNLFPVRLIDDAYLADTLNDFVLKNRLRSPILTTYTTSDNKTVFDLYIDKFIKVGDSYYLNNNLLPYQFRISYIAKPAKVAYNEDVNGRNVDCDLPEYMHVDILKHAVDLYRTAVSGSLYGSQQQQPQEQSQQRAN